LRHKGEIPEALKKIYSYNKKDVIFSVSFCETDRKGKKEDFP